MKQFNPLIPVCSMCGATHWPGAPHVFDAAPVTDRTAPYVQPFRPLSSDLIPSEDISSLVTVSESVVFDAPVIVKGPPVYEHTPQSKQKQNNSVRMKEYWARKRAEKAAAAESVAVPDWMEPDESS